MKKFALAAVVAATISALLPAAAMAQNVATVNGKPVPKARVETLIQQVTKSGQQQRSPELEAQVKDEVVRREIFMQEAEKRGVPQSADYKAQRSSRPSLLKEQWPHLAPLVEAFGYPNVSVEGYEADDVIAALTDRAKEQGIPVMVVTGDALTVRTTSSVTTPQLGVVLLVTVIRKVRVPVPVTLTTVVALFGLTMIAVAVPVVANTLHCGVPPETVPVTVKTVGPGTV